MNTAIQTVQTLYNQSDGDRADILRTVGRLASKDNSTIKWYLKKLSKRVRGLSESGALELLVSIALLEYRGVNNGIS
jgi:hypothetical protein